jgi:hypothetical protein
MNIEKQTDDFSFTGSEKDYILDYGTLKQGAASNVSLIFTSEKPLTDFQASPSCGGCTVVKQRKLTDNQYKVTIRYDSSLLGRIMKSVKIDYVDEEGTNRIKIMLTGLITR